MFKGREVKIIFFNRNNKAYTGSMFKGIILPSRSKPKFDSIFTKETILEDLGRSKKNKQEGPHFKKEKWRTTLTLNLKNRKRRTTRGIT